MLDEVMERIWPADSHQVADGTLLQEKQEGSEAAAGAATAAGIQQMPVDPAVHDAIQTGAAVGTAAKSAKRTLSNMMGTRAGDAHQLQPVVQTVAGQHALLHAMAAGGQQVSVVAIGHKRWLPVGPLSGMSTRQGSTSPPAPTWCH